MINNRYVTIESLREKFINEQKDLIEFLRDSDNEIPLCTNLETKHCIRCTTAKSSLVDSLKIESALFRKFSCGHIQMYKTNSVYPYQLKIHKGPKLARLASVLNQVKDDKEMTPTLLKAILIENNINFPMMYLDVITHKFVTRITNDSNIGEIIVDVCNTKMESVVNAFKAMKILTRETARGIKSVMDENAGEGSDSLIVELSNDYEIDDLMKQLSEGDEVNKQIIKLGTFVDIPPEMQELIATIETQLVEPNNSLISRLCNTPVTEKLVKSLEPTLMNESIESIMNECSNAYELLIILTSKVKAMCKCC